MVERIGGRAEDIRMGDIGPVRREVTFEPVPENEPITVPEPEPVPA